jgi:hypothetical protein
MFGVKILKFFNADPGFGIVNYVHHQVIYFSSDVIGEKSLSKQQNFEENPFSAFESGLFCRLKYLPLNNYFLCI